MAKKLNPNVARALNKQGLGHAVAGPRKAPRASKYSAKPCTVDGRRFASQGEARRYLELQQLERAGKISQLLCQPRYLLQEAFTDGTGERHRAIHYVADFQYQRLDGRVVVEDFKGWETEAFKLKRKLFLFRYQGLLLILTRKH